VFWEHGFAVFYSPPIARPDLLLVGFNPGVSSDAEPDFVLDTALAVPERHDYFQPRPYRLAGAMIRLFEDIDRRALLERSVKVNLIPFRSRDKRQWRALPAAVRAELEDVSRQIFLDIVHALEPARILTEGLETFDTALRWLGFAPGTVIRGRRGRRIYARVAAPSGPAVIGIPHLSWPVAREDVATIAIRLRADLAD